MYQRWSLGGCNFHVYLFFDDTSAVYMSLQRCLARKRGALVGKIEDLVPSRPLTKNPGLLTGFPPKKIRKN